MTAAELLEKPESWCQGSFAKDKDGKTVALRNEAACQFCASGAILKVYEDINEVISNSNKIRRLLKGESLVVWNDKPDRTHADVLALLKEAGV